MTQGRYDLTEFEWKTIQPLLPNKPRGVPRVRQQQLLPYARDPAAVRLHVAKREHLRHPAAGRGRRVERVSVKAATGLAATAPPRNQTRMFVFCSCPR